MDCARCEELLIASLEQGEANQPVGELGARGTAAGSPRAAADEEVASTAGEIATLHAHLAGCEGCREFQRLLGGAAEAVPPADLTESILMATSSRWAAVFERLGADLPVLASMEPDVAFLDDVLAATTGDLRADVVLASADVTGAAARSSRPRDPAVSRLRLAAGAFGRSAAARGHPADLWRRVADNARLAALWQRLVTRPRLALEGAWVGALALVLLAGLQAPRLDASPVETLAEIREQRVEPAIDSAFDQLVEIGGQTRAAAAARARGVWANRIVPVFETGRRVWCESFGCEPTDDTTNEPNRDGYG